MDVRQRSAFEKGAAARKHGKSSDANPYHHATSIQSKNFWAWNKGWAKQDAEIWGLSPTPHEDGGTDA